MLYIIYSILLISIVYFLYVLVKCYTGTSIKITAFDFKTSNTGIPHYLVFDTETTGIPPREIKTYDDWPYVVQLAWIVLDKDFNFIKKESYYIQQIKPIPASATKIHKITDSLVAKKGKPIKTVLDIFIGDLRQADTLVAHNIRFDAKMMRTELDRNGYKTSIMSKINYICTMEEGREFCELSPKYYYDGMVRKYKSPTLSELTYKCFGKHFSQKHDASEDALVTAKCLKEMATYLKSNTY